MNKARKRGDASSCLSDLRPNQHLWSNYKTKMIKNSLIVPLAVNISSRRCQAWSWTLLCYNYLTDQTLHT